MADAKRVLGGRYEVDTVLGEGGMAKVFRGTDRVLGRTVAVKVLSPQFAEDRNFVERFRREAQAAAALNHPNIVSVFDTGSAGNVHYIVMEYVEGRTLRDVIRTEGPLLPQRTTEIGEAVCRGLSAAHAKGLVHRDIKPGNIMITSAGQVKVMDFGIARATTSDTMTQTAAVLGTASYLSPEQAQGEPLDHRSDIYSLGVVVYEMLTGRAPFAGDSPVSIAYKHVTEDPVPPSNVNPDVPTDLDAVVMKAMAKNPDNRYSGGEEMAEDLHRVREGLPVAATPVLTGETTQMIDRGGGTQVLTTPVEELEEEAPEEEPRRRWGLIAAIVLIVLALLGLAAWALTQLLLGGRMVRVPDVVGSTEQIAREILTERGFGVEVERRFRPNREEGLVYEQEPPGGRRAEEGSTVTLFVSRGARQVEVPEVTGQSQDEATAILEDAGLSVGSVTQSTSEEAAGLVIAQSPEAGSRVDQGSSVDLVVSSGPATVTVPDVVCDPADGARDQIEGAGLEYQEGDDVFSEDCPPDTVASQNPSGGTEVAPGTTVTVNISMGESPDPGPSPDD